MECRRVIQIKEERQRENEEDISATLLDLNENAHDRVCKNKVAIHTVGCSERFVYMYIVSSISITDKCCT